MTEELYDKYTLGILIRTSIISVVLVGLTMAYQFKNTIGGYDYSFLETLWIMSSRVFFPTLLYAVLEIGCGFIRISINEEAN